MTFYGLVRGNRGAATRGGSKNSGFKATAQSFDGSIISYLDYDNEGKLKVRLEIADGSSSYGDIVFNGTLDELRKKLKSLTDEKTNDVIVEFKLKDLTQESFNGLNLMQMIVNKTGKPGKFEQGIFKITINKVVDHKMELVNLNDNYYLSRLISY